MHSICIFSFYLCNLCCPIYRFSHSGYKLLSARFMHANRKCMPTHTYTPAKQIIPRLWPACLTCGYNFPPHTHRVRIFPHNRINLSADYIAHTPFYPSLHTYTPLPSFGIIMLDASQTEWLVSHWSDGTSLHPALTPQPSLCMQISA